MNSKHFIAHFLKPVIDHVAPELVVPMFFYGTEYAPDHSLQVRRGRLCNVLEGSFCRLDERVSSTWRIIATLSVQPPEVLTPFNRRSRLQQRKLRAPQKEGSKIRSITSTCRVRKTAEINIPICQGNDRGFLWLFHVCFVAFFTWPSS